MWAPADVRSHYCFVRYDPRATLLVWASKKELRLLAKERSTYRLSSGATLLLLAGISIPGRSPLYCFRQTKRLPERRYGTAAARRNQCPVETRRLLGEPLCALRSKSLNRIPVLVISQHTEGNPSHTFAEVNI